MTFIRIAAVAAASLAALGGCAAPDRSANGTTVRAIMASQMLPPQPQSGRGTDAATAIAGYANYQRSYVTPVAQGDSAMIGSGISGK